MLKYITLFAVLGAAVLAQENSILDDLLEQEMQLPCTPKPCVPICKPVTKYVTYGSFKLPYQENVCAPDQKCLAAAAACIAKLQAAMKVAEVAEKDMIAKSKAANSAKATKAQKDAAAASKNAEEAAAKKALDGAKAVFEVAEKEAATAKAASVAAAKNFADKDKVMRTRLGQYEKAKSGHLNAQKAYANAKGEAAKAAAAYAAAVKAHCDAEAVHAAAVENIGHGQLKKDECRKHSVSGLRTWYCAIRHSGGNNILKKTYSLSEAQTVLGTGSHGRQQAIIPMTGSKAGDPHTLPKTWSGGSMYWSSWHQINSMRAKCATAVFNQLSSTQKPKCKPVSTATADAGYTDAYRGWYDVQGCGTCNDYCRWVGNTGSGGNPAKKLHVPGKKNPSWWSCRLAGTNKNYSPRSQFRSFKFKKCSGKGGKAI